MTEMPELPHHKLIAYGVARDLLFAVRAAQVKDAKLRDEALRSAKSACLNCAEGVGRVSLPDKARAFTIARGEACEAAAAVEVAALCGDASVEDARLVGQLAHRLVAGSSGAELPEHPPREIVRHVVKMFEGYGRPSTPVPLRPDHRAC